MGPAVLPASRFLAGFVIAGKRSPQECGLAGKLEDGRAHAQALLPVVQAAFAEPNPAVFKGVLHAQGRIATPDLRAPMTNASAGAIRRCLDAVERGAHP